MYFFLSSFLSFFSEPGFGSVIESYYVLVPVRPMIAHVRFCIVYPIQCIDYTDSRSNHINFLSQLQFINSYVNMNMIPRDDHEYDSWDIDFWYGDCEDYALQKRSLLLSSGWPSNSMRMGIIQLSEVEYHALLLVRVGSVDYILDNLDADVLELSRSSYVFTRVQSLQNSRDWFSLRRMDGLQ